MAFLVPTFGACGVAGALVVRTWCGWLNGAPALLAHMVAITAALLAVHIAAGAVGLFTPVAALMVALVLAAGVYALVRRSPPAARARTPRGRFAAARDGRVSLLLAVAATLATAGCALALIRDVAGAPINSIDALNFQVAIPVRWLQTESIWGLHQFIADYSNATYPHHGNILVAAVMLPFDSAFLVRLVAVPFWAMTGVAVYALARELGAPRGSSILAAAAFCALPMMLRTGLEGVQTDPMMLACFATGAVFLLRHHRSGARAELVLAAVALGIALGTKWYAVPSVAVVLAVWALGRAAGRRRRLVVHFTAVTGLLLATGGFWFLRNWVETGNPLFPQGLGPIFSAPPDPLRELGGFTLAHYLFDFDVWDVYLRPAFASTLGWSGAVLAAGALLAAALLPGARRQRSRPAVYALSEPGTVAPVSVAPVAAVLAATLLLAGAYLLTPYSAFGPEGRPLLAGASTRYGLPALLGAAVLTAWAAGRAGRLRLGVEALLALAVLDGLRRGFDLPAGKIAGGMIAAAGIAVAGVLLAERVRASRALAAAVVTSLLLGGLVASDAVRRRANQQGYGQFDPAIAWIEHNAPTGQAHRGSRACGHPTASRRSCRPSGRDSAIEVAVAGEFREHFLRPLTQRRAFTARLAGFDLLVVGRGAPPRPQAREEQWARAAGWRPIVASERLALLAAP